MSFIVKNTTIIGPLDLIAPHSCRGCGHIGEPLCERCKNYIIKNHVNLCPKCKNIIKNGKCKKCKLPPTYSIGPREDLLNQIIHDYKYKSSRALGIELAGLLNCILPDEIKNYTIVPLPTATSHIRSRGFDHTFYIAKKLARLRHLEVSKILLRSKNTVQVGSDKMTRLKQAESAYEINPKIKIDKDTTYILFDDVWTTGASMCTAVKKLQQAGAKKIIIVLLAVSRI